MKSTLVPILFSALLISGACTMKTADKHDSTEKSTTNTVASDTAKVVYQCPMKCEGDTAYLSMGSCRVCGMDLEKVERK